MQISKVDPRTNYRLEDFEKAFIGIDKSTTCSRLDALAKELGRHSVENLKYIVDLYVTANDGIPPLTIIAVLCRIVDEKRKVARELYDPGVEYDFIATPIINAAREELDAVSTLLGEALQARNAAVGEYKFNA